MNYWKPLLLLAATLAASPVAASWLTDFNAAKAQAGREGKTVLINFTGSDWCGWCIKLKQEILSQPEFEAFADKHLVLVEVDFPKRKPLSPAQQQVNRNLAGQYRVDGFPTLVFVNAQGQEIRRGGYEPGGVKPFVQNLAKFIGGPAAAPPPAMVATARARPTAPEPTPPLFGGAPAAPPQRFTELVLQNISDKKHRRFALLNNQTLAAGETARVKLEDKEVRVRCLEIRERSILVAVEGQEGSREIALRD
jgi:thioredoxin-related protein